MPPTETPFGYPMNVRCHFPTKQHPGLHRSDVCPTVGLSDYTVRTESGPTLSFFLHITAHVWGRFVLNPHPHKNQWLIRLRVKKVTNKPYKSQNSTSPRLSSWLRHLNRSVNAMCPSNCGMSTMDSCLYSVWTHKSMRLRHRCPPILASFPGLMRKA